MKFLIAGLGNIGAEYEMTRHNIGFEVLNFLAKEASASFEVDRHVYITEIKHKGKSLTLIKPTTYMNLSGKAILYWKNQLKIEQSQILVITDDLALDFGKIRMKAKGSDGGHNGLKSINESLGNNEYPRLRFGIGANFSKGRQVDYVLGKWSIEENQKLPELIQKSADAALSFTAIGIERTMNFFNS